MATDTKWLCVLEQKRHDTVIGWYRREIETIFGSDYYFPKEIISISISFYGNGVDTFDPECIADNYSLDRDIQEITNVGETKVANAFLKRIVDSKCHKWRFKMNRENKNEQVMIGIWRVNEDKENGMKPPPLNMIYTANGSGYGYHATGMKLCDTPRSDTLSEYGSSFGKKDDIIDMILDFDNLSLSYFVNGVNQGKAFDIKQGRYRAVVLCYCKHDTVQILDPQQEITFN